MEKYYKGKLCEIIYQPLHSMSWVRCIDDTLLWADTLLACLKQTFYFIQECAMYGVVFNQKKFQFAMGEV